MKVSRRKLAGGLLVAAGIVLFITPFLFTPPSQPSATTPPPTGGNGHGGNNGGGGTSPPPCATNCPSTDTQPPTTTIQLTGSLKWSRNSITYFYPNITVTLYATDDQNLTRIALTDNETTDNFTAQGKSSSATVTLNSQGLHMLSYYSIDKAANKEKTHNTIVALNQPDLSDIQNIIANSSIDNPGIKNALIAKLSTAQAQFAAGQIPNALNALSNQLNALDGKHGLNQATVDLIDAMIQTVTS